MTEGNFVDYVKIFATSGNGGKGSMHLHREKYITKGGPDGGDGGRGGHIILRGNSNYWTLLHLKFKRHIKAEIFKFLIMSSWSYKLSYYFFFMKLEAENSL